MENIYETYIKRICKECKNKDKDLCEIRKTVDGVKCCYYEKGNAMETEEEVEERNRIENIKAELPEQCKNCSFLVITNARKQKVYCPYRIKKCMLGVD